MKYEKGKLIREGKTKRIFEIVGKPSLVIVQSKDDITAFDDPGYTKQFGTKAIYATTTTSRVFETLKVAGIPVAYVEKISDTEFVAEKCTMIPLEVVARRFAVGSSLKRYPQLAVEKGEIALRFHQIKTEFFLKTTRGQLINADGDVLIEGLDPRKGEEDPFIINPYDECWKLFHPKKPAWNPEADLKKTIKLSQIIPNLNLGSPKSPDDMVYSITPEVGAEPEMTPMQHMEDILREVFLLLEGAWNTLGLRLIDMKIEFGVNEKGKLFVADVIDNDSWRLRDQDWKELSKQAFRDGEDLNEVEEKYGTVASLVERFRMPKQALVIWRGSEKDELPEIDDYVKKYVEVVEVVYSGHKSTKASINKLNEIVGNYPDGGVIIAKVGRSNGLGPILAAHTTWPVIAIPATLKSFPNDIWSSVRMPSLVPMATAWPDKNAIRLAVNFLAAKNPALHMWSQKQMESLDP